MGQDVEVVLLKQLSSCLRIPIALLDPDGNISYFNEPAESIFGLRFEETGGLRDDEWVQRLQPSDEHHVPLEYEKRPLMTALHDREPTHRRVHIRTSDGQWREIEVTALPLTAVGERFLGAFSLFWQPGSIAANFDDEVEVPDQQAVETILTRRIAETWTAPVLLLDPLGRLLYYNPAAEPVLGERFPHGSRPVGWEALQDVFEPRDEEGKPLQPHEHPLAIARNRREPVHRVMWIRGLDGHDRRIAATAIPLVGQSDRLVGVLGVFWESHA